MKHVLLLPGGVSLQEEHAFLRLPHPRTGHAALYLPAYEGLLEVQRVSPAESRTWFIDQDVVSDGSLAMLSPIDPVLLIAGILERLPNHLFREESDIWETAASLDGDDNEQGEWDTFAFGGLDCVKSKLIDVCDAEELDGQPEGRLYRLSTDKYIGRLRQKIDRMIDEADGIFGPYELESLGEQASNAKVFTSVNRALIKEGFGDGRGLGQAVQKELRIKTSIGILSAYLSPKTAGKLAASYEFTLTATITSATELSADYLPGRSNSDASSNVPSFDRSAKAKDIKKTAQSGSMSAAARAKEAQKKLDKSTSRGVKELRKVNTRGMNKLSSFFAKPAISKPKEEAAKEEAAKDEAAEEDEAHM